MKKRTYGTGSYVPRGDGKWRLFYKPKWSSKPLSKTVEAANEKAASRLLSDWVTELDKQSGPSVTVSISQIVELHLADMRRKGRDASSIAVVEQRCNKHLIPYFASIDFASPVKRAVIDKYVDTRLQGGAKRATVNRELSSLRRAIRLGIEGELIAVAPPRIEQLEENNTRTGFVDETAYSAILQKLPEHQQMLWCFAYRLGIRKGESLKLVWEWLLPYWNEPEPFIKVPGFDAQGNRITKSGKPHTIPLYHPELRAFVEMALVARDPNCPYLFQYRGKRLRNIRTGFEKACKEAGYEGVIFHDTRRTAVRRMEDAGIPRREAMQITGHLTETVYKRYDIGSEAGATEAGRKLREHESKRKFSPKFSPDKGVENLQAAPAIDPKSLN